MLKYKIYTKKQTQKHIFQNWDLKFQKSYIYSGNYGQNYGQKSVHVNTSYIYVIIHTKNINNLKTKVFPNGEIAFPNYGQTFPNYGEAFPCF